MNNYPAGGPGDSGSGPRLGPAQFGMLRVAALLVLAVVASGALLTALVWGKEGFGREDLPLCGAGLLVLGGAGGAWWLLCRRTPPAAHPVLFGAGIALLTLPGAVYAAFGARTVINTVRGEWLERRATISAYRETPLVWRGFPGPVGLRVELDLAIPAKLDGNLLPPRLALGGPEGFAARDYFSIRLSQLESRTLGRPVFQRLDDPAPGPLANGGSVHLGYDLYPGYVQRVTEDVLVCLDTTAITRARASGSQGRELGATWFFAGPSGLTVDLSTALTATPAGPKRARRPPGHLGLIVWRSPPAIARRRRVHPMCAGRRPVGGERVLVPCARLRAPAPAWRAGFLVAAVANVISSPRRRCPAPRPAPRSSPRAPWARPARSGHTPPARRSCSAGG
jgi:hypothetical protein